MARVTGDVRTSPPPGLAGAITWGRVFPGIAQQVGVARRFVGNLLDGAPFRDDAIMVTSELFTNAVVHTASGRPGGLVTVQVSRWLLGARISVTDQGSATEPVIRDAGGEPAESGHGLYMVACLSTSVDWRDDPAGRTIHAILGPGL